MKNFLSWFMPFVVLCVSIFILFAFALSPARGQDIYGSLLPSTVTRSNIGFSAFPSGNLQLNPISRNVRPFDTQAVINYTNKADDIRPKKKHPKDNICLHFSVKLH